MVKRSFEGKSGLSKVTANIEAAKRRKDPSNRNVAVEQYETQTSTFPPKPVTKFRVKWEAKPESVYADPEESAKAAPAVAKTSTEVLSSAKQVRVKAPEGATFVRVTDKAGKSSTMSLAAANKGDNAFRGVDVAKIEAGTIGKDKKFKPMKGDVAVEDRTPGISVGPGAASPIDLPGTPPRAMAAGRRIEAAPEGERPFGVMAPGSSGTMAVADALLNPRAAISEAGKSLRTLLHGMAGDSLPRTTAADRELGEAGVRYAAARQAAIPLADMFAAHTLEGTSVEDHKFGVALAEDNLRSVREMFRQQATERLANGDQEGAQAATAAANKVTSLIGAEGVPFRDEDEYQDFLADPAFKKAVGQHIQQWQEQIDPQFKMAQQIDPDVELPSRGLQTGARINLKAVFPDEPGVRPVGGTGGASLTATFRRKSPFGIRARGTGQVYEGSYREMMRNTFGRQLEIATKNEFDRQLVESGNAVESKPGQQIMIGGERGVAFPLSRKVVVLKEGESTKAIPQARNIYVRAGLAGEYRRAANVDAPSKLPVVTKAMNVLNRTALAGLTDFTTHTSNLLTALFNRPASGKLLTDSLLSATGRADVPVTVIKAILKAAQSNQTQWASLAEIGATREQTPRAGMTGRMLQHLDKTTRLMLDDTYQRLADAGLAEKSETARREYVNQVGQYNRRLQGPAIRFLRDTGFGPFATAGRTFNAMGVKMATLSPGVRATSPLAAAALRANVLSKWVGAAAAVGALNYLITHQNGGGVMGRPGTPLGSVDTGKDDSQGRPLTLPVFNALGLGRAMRVTGVRGAADSLRYGLTTGDAIDSAARDILNTAVGPAAGPAVRFGMIGATGYPPAYEVGRASPVAAPGGNQLRVNVTEALKEANPVVASYMGMREGKPWQEALARQLPRFTMAPGKSPELAENYPKIVGLAQTYAYADNVVHDARQMTGERRNAFVAKKLADMQDLPGLPADEQRTIVESILKRRKVDYQQPAEATP